MEQPLHSKLIQY